MHIKPIRNDDDLSQAFKHLEAVLEDETGTAEFDEIEILVTLIEAYEGKHFPVQHADPVDAIVF